MRDYRSLITEKLSELQERKSRLEALLAGLDEIDGEDGFIAESTLADDAPSAESAVLVDEDESLTDNLRRLVGQSSRFLPSAVLMREVSRGRHVKRQSVYATLNRLKKAGEVDNVEGKGWASPAVAERERRFLESRPSEVFDLADCAGWDIQHYKNHRVERAHLVALILQVHAGASENGGDGYTVAQANAVLDRLIRAAPTVLEAVSDVLAAGEIPEETESLSEVSTESRQQSGREGVRVTKGKYGDEFRDVPWPEQASGYRISDP